MAVSTQDVGLGAGMQQRATPYTPRNGSKVERATLTNVTACSPSRGTGPADQVFFRTRRPPRRRELILKGMRTQRCTDATVRLQVDSASTGHQRQMSCQGPQTAPASEKRTEEGASISSGLCGELRKSRKEGARELLAESKTSRPLAHRGAHKPLRASSCFFGHGSLAARCGAHRRLGMASPSPI